MPRPHTVWSFLCYLCYAERQWLLVAARIQSKFDEPNLLYCHQVFLVKTVPLWIIHERHGLIKCHIIRSKHALQTCGPKIEKKEPSRHIGLAPDLPGRWTGTSLVLLVFHTKEKTRRDKKERRWKNWSTNSRWMNLLGNGRLKVISLQCILWFFIPSLIIKELLSNQNGESGSLLE